MPMCYVLLMDVLPSSSPTHLFVFVDCAELNKSDEVMGLVDSGYRLDNYRALYEDERYQVLLPVPEELAVDTTMLPPRQVEGRAGRPKGPAQTKRFKSRGENSASSSFNVRLTPSSGTMPSVDGSAGVGLSGSLSQAPSGLSQTASGLSQGASALSQSGPGLSQGRGGLSQGVHSLSQGWSGLSQGAQGLAQGWGGLSQAAHGLSQGWTSVSHGGQGPS